MSKLRVLQVVTLASRSGKYGGPYDTSVEQSRAALTRDYEVCLLAGTLPDDEPAEYPEGVRLVIPRVRRLLPTRGFTSLLSFQFVRTAWVEIGRCDVLHISTARELVPFAVIVMAVVRRKPWIAQPHGMLTSRSSRFHQLIDCAMRPLLRRSSEIVALSEREANQVRDWLGSSTPKIRILGNPVPESAVPAERIAGEDVVLIGRLHRRKRVDVFACAAGIARQRGWQGIYSVVGPDEGELPSLQQAIDCQGAVKNLKYEGAVPPNQVVDRVRRACVFVLCSENEPWGNVLAMALKMQIPTVATESAALAPAIERYGAGITIPDGDAEALAFAVHRLLSDAALRDSVRAGAHALARDLLSADHQGATLHSLYSGAITGDSST